MIFATALDRFGIGYVMNDYVEQPLEDGRFVNVLRDSSPPFSGYHLYYASRRQLSPAFSLMVTAWRYRD
jgi:DNA-binding transcriptional LysR family regulator